MAEQARQEMLSMAQGQQAALDERGRRAVAAARGNFAGHVAETAFPFVPDHPYHPKDIVHLGGTMDYLVLDGLYEIRTNNADPSTLTVILVEVKWGSSRPSREQQAVIRAVSEGRMRAEVWTAKEENSRVTYHQSGRQLPH